MIGWKVAEELDRALEERKAYIAEAEGDPPAVQLQWRILNAEIALLMLTIMVGESRGVGK